MALSQQVVRPEPRMVAESFLGQETRQNKLDVLHQYEAVALNIDFMPPNLLQLCLYAFFHQESIKLFDLEEVKQYLTKMARKEEMEWQWVPLRQKDVLTSCFRDNSYRGSRYTRIYTGIIPFSTLKIVEKLTEKFGDRINFFVSDFFVPSADPFICVYVPPTPTPGISGEKIIVFDVWNEPEFK